MIHILLAAGQGCGLLWAPGNPPQTVNSGHHASLFVSCTSQGLTLPCSEGSVCGTPHQRPQVTATIALASLSLHLIFTHLPSFPSRKHRKKPRPQRQLVTSHPITQGQSTSPRRLEPLDFCLHQPSCLNRASPSAAVPILTSSAPCPPSAHNSPTVSFNIQPILCNCKEGL